MKELGDKDFDQIFKNRIKDGFLEYEEESWIKMEKKLRKKDRFVFYRNASIFLVFLSIGLGIYLTTNKIMPTGDAKASRKVKNPNEAAIEKINDLTAAKAILPSSQNNFFTVNGEVGSKPATPNNDSNIIATSTAAIAVEKKLVLEHHSQNITVQAPTNSNLKEGLLDQKINKKILVTLSVNVGPDFSSTENAIGGKSGMAIGLGVSFGFSKKLSLQTGMSYGSKNYKAQGYDYTFNNPNTINIISGIDASCKVLEIPLRASYRVMDNQKNSIDLNAGLSSYFMLKENYRFMYTAASARKDRYLEEKNTNQHYLSVIDLSATYNIKLKNKKFALGLEPYVKIPLSGIGEGNVPLKSSGISLKLNYELNKK